MNRKSLLAIVMVFVLIIGLGASTPVLGSSLAASSIFTGYYNMIGYEGIGTLGSLEAANGLTPPVADYVTTHCRYIDVQNTVLGHYFLRYPLHLPNGTNITKIALHVADYNPTGVMWAYLRSRKWDSREAGTTEGVALTDNSTDGDRTITMDFTTPVNVDNQTTEYWIDVSPQNSTAPGQLCVYGIQVTYTVDGAALPLVAKNY